MDKLIRIQEIDQILGSFMHEELPLGLLIVFMIGTAFLLNVVDLRDLTVRITVGYLVVSVLIVGFLVITAGSNRELTKERDVLEEAYYEELKDSAETVTVKTNDIVKSEVVSSFYCPLEKDMEEKELHCHLVEFVTEGEISQVIIPLKKAPYASVTNEIQITYYDFSVEERKFFSKEYKLDDIYSRGLGSHGIDTNGWAFGKSIQK